MKKALLVVMTVALVIGFASCDILKPGVDYFRFKADAMSTYETTTITYDSTYNTTDSVWDLTHDTTVVTSTKTVIGETTLDDGTEVWEIETKVDTVITTSYIALDKENDEADFYHDKADTEPAYSIPFALDSWTIPIDSVNSITYAADGTEDVEIGEETYKGAAKIKVTYPEGAGYAGAFDWWDTDYGMIKSWHAIEMGMEMVYFKSIDVTMVLIEVEK